MRYKAVFCLSFVILWAVVFCGVSNRNVSAQPTSKEKSKLKNFGSSLKKHEKKSDANSKDKEKKNGFAEEETIQVETNLVVNDILVLNQKGNLIAGLKKDDFVVTEDGIPQDIGIFSYGENTTMPRSIVLIIDYSGSQLPYINNSIEAAKILVDKLSPQDRMAIVTDDVKLLVQFTNDKTLLKKELESLRKKALSGSSGRSEQFSALLAVLNEMFDTEDTRPIIIFQTDGDEFPFLKPIWERWRKYYTEKNFGFDDIKETIERKRATIYSIIPGIRFVGLSIEEQLARAEVTIEKMMRHQLKITDKQRIADSVKKYSSIEVEERLAYQSSLVEVAKLSGGHTDYIEKPEDAANVYDTIFTTISNRYVIGYYTKNQEKDGKRRDVKIEVCGHPEYIILGGKSYFAPQNEK